ncbi:MAG: TolC family protein [Phycisphaerae bacterium]|nr:TolC family protein [Phycisphaerae bacterium]
MRSHMVHTGIIVITLALASAGCVQPGAWDGGSLGQYQRARVDRAPQPRGSDALEPYRPARETKLPTLEVRTDADTGRRHVRLSLGDAVIHALAASPEIGVVAFDPAVSREEVVQAAAAFDAEVFAEWARRKTDERTDSTAGGGEAEVRSVQAGLRQKIPTGAEWVLSWAATDTRDDVITRTLHPRYERKASLQITQPLLRNAWPAFNLAQLRLARVSHRQTLEAFRETVEEVVAAVHATYWQLVRARGDVTIQEELIAYTQDTLDRLRARAELDATSVQISQTEAALHAREEALLLAVQKLADVREQLARLISHPELPPTAPLVIEPTTQLVTAPVDMDVNDQLLTALHHSPQLAQARLEIEAADIRVTAAESEALPRLDITAGATLQGLAGGRHGATEDLGTLDYAGYELAFTFEYPLGNRQRLANLRAARRRRHQAVASFQNAADRLAVRVRERLRAAETARRRVSVQQAAVHSAEVQLQAIEDTEKVRGALTPEFILVKLQAQETLADARRRVLQARQDYNVALAELARETGTIADFSAVNVALPTGESTTRRAPE